MAHVLINIHVFFSVSKKVRSRTKERTSSTYEWGQLDSNRPHNSLFLNSNDKNPDSGSSIAVLKKGKLSTPMTDTENMKIHCA